MKLKLITAIALSAMAIISCDEDTATLGNSLTSPNDKLLVSTKNFNVFTQSVGVDSVYSRERQCYVGRVIDPETNAFVESQFTTQFNMMESITTDLPKKDSILSLDNGLIAADSCVIHVFFNVPSSYGDTLTAMKLRLSELDKPIQGNNIHYTNFDPRANGYIREGGYQVDQMFTLRDLTMSDSLRNLINTNLTSSSDNGYWDMMRIRLNKPYTDKNGITYNNYGSYVLRSFYDHPEYFKNSYSFVHNVSPGFQFETNDGLGLMARIQEIDMYTYYHFLSDTTVYHTYLRTTATEEIVQTNKVTNDKEAINLLVADNSCTYLKTPSGIFTEVTLPVEEIAYAHSNDSLLSAKISFQRLNNTTEDKELAFSAPSKLLLIEKDSLNAFFEGNNLYNNVYAFETSLSNNAYTFSNISNLITRMNKNKSDGEKLDVNWTAKHPDWNKALLVPIEEVTVTTGTNSYYSSATTSIVSLKNQMGLTSTKLVRGTSTSPLNLEVIYAKFQE